MQDKIRTALAGIRLSGGQRNIVDAGMISGLTVTDTPEGAIVRFAIEVTPEQGAGMEPLRLAAEKAVARLPGIASVMAVLTAQLPAAGNPPKTERPPRVIAKLELPSVKRIVAIASGKGGVGKSTTAVNLAVAMALNGLKTGLLDADIYGPSLPRMLKMTGRPQTTEDKKLIPPEKFGLKAMSMGLLVAEDNPMIWRGPMVHTAITQLFRDVAWGELDIIIVDMPPGTGDAHLTLAQNIPLSGAVIVSTPQDIALIDARKGLNMFRTVDVPVLGLIENMSYFLCPHCGERSDIFSHGGARAEAEKLELPFLGEIPLNIAVRTTSDEGTPITHSQPDSPIAQNYRAMAKKLWEGFC